jgi:hypothetical protein
LLKMRCSTVSADCMDVPYTHFQRTFEVKKALTL